ncbi:MAG: NAD(P)H-hydrate epimerase [bacterium]
MLPAGKSSDAKIFDKRAMEKGVASIILMENAAFSLYIEAVKIIKSFKPEKIVLFAGRGGNGGDGFALLRILRNRGCSLPMSVVPMFKEKALSGDPLKNYEILPQDVSFTEMDRISGKILFVDAMLGTGLSRKLSSKYIKAVDFVNDCSDKKVLSVDVPTGINSDTGSAMPAAVKADITVSFGIMKTGLYCSDGISHSGRIVHGKISAPEECSKDAPFSVLEEKDLFWKPPAVDSYKTKNGHALFMAGDRTKRGAILIAARAFMASGGGLATVALEHEDIAHTAGLFPGLMLTDIHTISKRKEDFDVVVAGPGLTELPETTKTFFESFEGYFVLDAGMLHKISEDRELFKMFASKKSVLTPHPGELSKMMSKLTDLNNLSWPELVEKFPLPENHVLFAKNAASFIRFGKSMRILPHGASALSFGGTGDALTGIIASALCKNKNQFDAASSAGLLHRKAGILLEKNYHASFHDIDALLSCLPDAMKGS